MKSATFDGSRANRLLRLLIVVSLGIHGLFFMAFADLYEPQTESFIELTVRQVEKPSAREISRPTHPIPAPEPPQAPIPLKVKHFSTRRIYPVKLESVETDLRETPVEAVATHKKLGNPDPVVSERQPPDPPAAPVQKKLSPREYLEMVRTRIENHKHYPKRALLRRIEGRITVSFCIESDGHVIDLKILKSARDRGLDRAAVEAVRAASPFQRPPDHLFSGPIPVEITVVFEIT